LPFRLPRKQGIVKAKWLPVKGRFALLARTFFLQPDHRNVFSVNALRAALGCYLP